MGDACANKSSDLDVFKKRFLTGKTLLLLLLFATTTECWPWGSTPDCPPGPEPTCPLNPVDDADNYFEHPTDCHYYIHCDGSRRPICHQCSPNTYYSTKIMNCVWPMDAACTHNDTTRLGGLQPPICVPGRCDLGEGKIRDYQDCSYFWECKGDKKVRNMCPPNQHFNARKMQCLDICVAGCEKPETIPECGSRCQVGQLRNIKCKSYEICEKQNWVEKQCPSNTKFDENFNKCVAGCCGAECPECKHGDIGNSTCSSYTICENNVWKRYDCSHKQKYDPYLKTCIAGCCGPDCGPTICETGKLGNYNCSTYTICENDDWKEHTCPFNQRFDQYQKKCVDGCCGINCEKPRCPNGKIGDFTCSTYKICENDDWKLYSCLPNQRFDQELKRCIEGCCGNNCGRPICRNGDIGSFNCSTYEICEYEEWKQYTCPPNQRFDKYRKGCVDGRSCGAMSCRNGEIGAFTCSSYKICENKIWKQYTCPSNQRFDKVLKTCVNGCCGADCTPILCRNGEIGDYTCSTYKICENGAWKEYTCPFNQRFDEIRKTCMLGYCEIPECINGDIDTFTCSTYKICENKEWKEYTCPSDQRFDEYRKICVHGCCETNCGRSICRNGDIDSSTCSTYKVCENKDWKEYKCPSHQRFDQSLKTCVDGFCCLNGEVINFTCSTYTICEDEKWKTYTCPAKQRYDRYTKTCVNGCCGADCDGGRCIDGEVSDTGCSTYTVCENGVWKEKMCYPDEHYDKRLKECVSGPCPCSPERLTYEDPCSCDMYYKCTNGMKVLSMCQKGLHYNETTQSCQIPCSNICPKLFLRKPECCASTKGKPEPVCPTTKYRIYLPHPSDSKWFYLCENSVLYCNRCPPGYRWNIDTDTCDESCLCP